MVSVSLPASRLVAGSAQRLAQAARCCRRQRQVVAAEAAPSATEVKRRSVAALFERAG